jgi:multiple sugar transport system substrate-binding protein
MLVMASRRRWLARAALLPLAPAVPALSAACGATASQSGSGPAPPAGLRRDVTVQVMTGISTADQALFEGVINAWREAHAAGPRVEWGTPGGDIAQKLQALLAAGTPPDVVAMSPSLAVGFADRGQLLALDPFFRRERYDLSDFFDLAVSQYQWKGKHYGLPRGMSNQSLFVNQTLFDQVGLPYPPTKVEAGGWDFDAFLHTALRLTKRAGSQVEQYGFIVGRGLRGGWGQWVWTNGAEIFNRDFTRCTLDDPRAVEALQFMQDLIYKYRVAPTPDDESAAGGASTLFIGAGKAAMRINPVASVEQHRRASFKWDYAVNPRGKGKRLTTGGGVGWEIVAATSHPDESWAVFRHLVSAESAKLMATLWYPGRKSALEYLLKLDPDLPPRSRWVGADGQKIVHPDPIFPAWEEIQREIINPALTALWQNEKPAAQVVEDIVPKVNAALASPSK